MSKSAITKGKSTTKLLGFTLAAATVLSLPAVAQTAAPPPGRLLASNCFLCHGTNGAGSSFDSLIGESVDAIYKKLREMHSEDPGNNIIKAHARGYTDEQMRQISVYFSQQPKTSDNRD